jgi:hypothetical protein
MSKTEITRREMLTVGVACCALGLAPLTHTEETAGSKPDTTPSSQVEWCQPKFRIDFGGGHVVEGDVLELTRYIDHPPLEGCNSWPIRIEMTGYIYPNDKERGDA